MHYIIHSNNTVPSVLLILSTKFDSFMLLFIKGVSLFKVFNNESNLSSATSVGKYQYKYISIDTSK